jgi:hypothetical protein
MVAGHFGFAAGVKSQVPSAPLWALMLATQWLDVFFVPLYLMGIETIDPVDPANPNFYGGGVIHAVYTHSLVGALLLSALAGALAWALFGRQIGGVIGGVAFSHWLLDLVVHRGDLPILPGNAGGCHCWDLACGVSRWCRRCSSWLWCSAARISTTSGRRSFRLKRSRAVVNSGAACSRPALS